MVLQAHKTNLAIEILGQMPIVSCIEELLAGIYTFFCKSPKKHLEFVKLAELLNSRGNKILQNIKTRWLNMIGPAVKIMNEYMLFLVKMSKDTGVMKPTVLTTKCFQHLTDIQVLLGLAAILPMLQLANKFIKYAQRNDVFVSDYLAVVKELKSQFRNLYLEERSKFTVV